MGDPVRIGVSACLLGDEVRFDGGHKRDHFLTEVLARYVEWVPFCPELEVGMGVPREPVRLVQEGGSVALVGTKSLTDWTGPLRAHADERVRGLDVHGAVFKKESPTCGLHRVRVYPGDGLEEAAPTRGGTGLFASAFIAAHPLVPVEEEGRLRDEDLRANFVERVFAYARLRTLLAEPYGAARLQAFHGAHKYQLLAHSTVGYRELGRLVAVELPPDEKLARYATGFMETLARHATRGRQANVQQHILGHFRGAIDAADRDEAQQHIDDYRRGLVPLAVPLTLLQHFARRHGDAWLRGQTYLAPMPKELLYG